MAAAASAAEIVENRSALSIRKFLKPSQAPFRPSVILSQMLMSGGRLFAASRMAFSAFPACSSQYLRSASPFSMRSLRSVAASWAAREAESASSERALACCSVSCWNCAPSILTLTLSTSAFFWSSRLRASTARSSRFLAWRCMVSSSSCQPLSALEQAFIDSWPC